MHEKTQECMIGYGGFDWATETLCHKDKKQGQEWINLCDASSRGEGSRRNSIDQDGEKGWRSEVSDPGNPAMVEAEGKKGGFHIVPTEFVKIFGEIKFKDHTWRFGGLERVNHLMR